MNSRDSSKMKSPEVDNLFEAVLSLETLDECYAFFEDVCTINELQAMSLRLNVASRLFKGETQQEIKENTGASSATISRVNRAFRYGNNAYSMILNRVSKDLEQ